ncbi:DNA mismatch repair protein MutS [Mycobacterium sp. pUA109]|uniref:MutS-related protein n=1 Tax=Mycobacterium sp. pUA109 TaxID=3238982 RepID=UPI00351B9DD4
MASFTSILFPHGTTVDEIGMPDCFADLYLDQVIATVTTGHTDNGLEQFFYAPQHDVSTVNYRHEVFRDLERDEVRRAIENFVAGMRTMRQRLHQSAHLWHPLQQQGWFIYAVEAYCSALKMLREDLAQTKHASRGLRDFVTHVCGYVDSDTFQTLVADTQNVQAELHTVRYAVHIQGLHVHVEKYDDQPDYSAQVAATFQRFVTETAKNYRVRLPDFPDMDHVEEQVTECVAKLYPQVFALLKAFSTDNAHFVEPIIDRFDREIHFYLSYLTFMRLFTAAGAKFSYPDVTNEPGVVCANEAFDLALAIKSLREDKPVIRNGFRLSGTERIFVITGPNQGGKTTFARTIGQCAYLAALGCPVPATQAAFTLPDAIYTHFERQESLATLHGKLDDELVRIHDILSRATATSLIVMNESFASTTADDALQIGTEVLERMIRLRCVAVYVTFLDELANFDSTCVSMVGEVAPEDPTRRTFKFSQRPADGLAYAAALAGKYGLTHDGLVRRITQ